ncbi:MAG TPA: aminotransferase DegT, partial [Betaproteobacteria bacterium]|nr:aminotransferase DegT [Betaproteobacteria bacterium]
MEPDWITLTDPDISTHELVVVTNVLKSSRLSAGPVVEQFEDAFAEHLGRRYGIAVASGTIGLMVSLRALGIGPGDEVIASAYAWHQIAHAIVLVGATPVFADIDYWSGTLSVEKAAAKITPHTRAIVAGNTNGHPAAWEPFRALVEEQGIKLIEDSTEAIGSRYKGQVVGTFGDLSIFDFSQPSALCCGEGAMIVTDDHDLASELRYHRSRGLDER